MTLGTVILAFVAIGVLLLIAVLWSFYRLGDQLSRNSQSRGTTVPPPLPGTVQRREFETEAPATLDEIAKARRVTESLCKPAVLVELSDVTSVSHLGGVPPSYPGFSWPRGATNVPMVFLATIDLAELPENHGLDFLPSSGLLSFFVDVVSGGAGYDPRHQAGFKVLFQSEMVATAQDADVPKDHPPDARYPRRYPRRNLSFIKASLPPDWEREELDAFRDLEFTVEAFCAYRTSLYMQTAHHQIGGYAEAVQDPHMEMECQLVTNGLFVDDSRQHNGDPRFEETNSGAADWRLLLQLEFNKEFNPYGGEYGMLYCWIRRQDALAGRFERSWMLYQCT
jgi:uncharacterized protein YwqG